MLDVCFITHIMPEFTIGMAYDPHFNQYKSSQYSNVV